MNNPPVKSKTSVKLKTTAKSNSAAKSKTAAKSKSFCGYIALAGRTNAGKSSLLNVIADNKASVTSPRPQTTRSVIYGIVTEGNKQAIFVDTPGAFNEQKVTLNNLMYKQMMQGLYEAQIVLLVVAANRQSDDSLHKYFDFIAEQKLPVVVALSKVDLLRNKNDMFPLVDSISKLADDKGVNIEAIVPVSVVSNKNIQLLRDTLMNMLPEAPFAHNEKVKTLSSDSFIACELLREQMFRKLRREIPFGIGVICEKMEQVNNHGKKQDKNIRFIDLTVLAKKENHKPIILGSRGSAMKEVASLARKSMEEFFNQQVMLRVRVKVEKDWDNSPSLTQQAVLDQRNTLN